MAAFNEGGAIQGAVVGASHPPGAKTIEDEEPIKKEAWVLKKGGLRWQKRWFVLKHHGHQPGKLSYYHEQPGAEGGADEPKMSVIELDADVKVDLLPERKHALSLIANSRARKALKFQFESAPEQEEWLAALRCVIRRAIKLSEVAFAGTRWSIDPRYELTKLLGKGSYGCVVAARDTQAGADVAIKKVENVFVDAVDAKRILREIRLMRHFRHPNLVRLHDVMEPPYVEDFVDLYIVLDLMPTDLRKLLWDPKVHLTDEQVQFFAYQLLCGVKYMGSAGVLHRDLKPENLLVDPATCTLRVCDLGLARAAHVAGDMHDEAPGDMTTYVVTRWYRAPELLLSAKRYTAAVDAWSCGVIVGEMLLSSGERPTPKPLLLPGRDVIHQIKLTARLLGRPKKEELWFVGNEGAVRFMMALPDRPPRPLAEVFPGASATALDLVAKMLTFDPAKRCAAADALAHPYVKEWRDPDVEKPAGFYIDMDDIEALRLTKRNLQKMFFDEVLSIHRPQLAPPGLGLDASPAFSSRSMASTNSSPECSSRSL